MSDQNKEKKMKKPLNRSITVGCISFIIALCVLLSLANLSLYQSYVYDSYREYIEDILDSTMSQIDGDDLEKCIKTGKKSEKYKDTLLFMDNLIDHFEDIHYFYAIRPLNTNKKGNVMSVFSAERYHDRYVDTEGNLYLGWISDDEFDQKTAKKFTKIMNGKGISYFKEKTEWGTDYTGAVPIKNSKGEGIAVLAVDIDISFLQKQIIRFALINIGIIIFLGAVFICLFLLWSRRNITKPIRELEQSAVGFVGHSHGQRDVKALSFDVPKIEKENEIKALSDAVVKMTEDMRDYVTDIINAEERAASMEKLANRDALTGVRNKNAYDNEIRSAEEQIKRGDKKIGLAVMDLNYLKKINDNYGHDKGNLAIKKLCRIICIIFTNSPVFRIGGDEFVVVLRGEDYDNYDKLVNVFNIVLDEIAADDTLEPWEKISAAMGAAFYDETVDTSMEDLFRRADKVMYEEKYRMKQRDEYDT